MKALVLSILSFALIAASAQAADTGIEVGIRQQSGDVDGTSSTKSQTGFQAGGVAAFQVNGPWHVRTGLLYTQRPLVVSTSPDTKYSMTYLDIPVAAMYKFEEYAGVFAGVSLAMNLDSSCDNGCTKVQDVKSIYVPLILGATFKFAPQLGGTIYFETGSGEVAQGLKNYRAVGANLLITFD